MSDPASYAPGYSFSGFQANSPTTPLPAPKLDAELANIGEAIEDHASAIEDVRRSDGALKNGIVTYESLALALQLIFDPTDGQAVADAVTVAQAAATAASGSATSAGTSATNAANSAAAAAASASSVNLALFLSKAGNLAGLGNVDTALANLTAMKLDASNATGRLAKTGVLDITDFNNALDTGFYSANAGSANSPDSVWAWLIHVMSGETNQEWVTQIAYRYGGASIGADNVLIYRRHSYNNAGTRTWTPWISNSAVPVGAVMSFPAQVAPPGFIKYNGALLSRTTYAALWAYANVSGNIVSEATWSGGNSGAFSTGDLSTTFRLPDGRGEFIRNFDDSRGVDSGRSISANQSDLLKDHTHPYTGPAPGNGTGTTPNYFQSSSAAANTGGVNGGLGGAETRPRNIALLACIKF